MDEAERILTIIEKADRPLEDKKKRAMCLAGVQEILNEYPEFNTSMVPDWVLLEVFKDLITAAKASRN